MNQQLNGLTQFNLRSPQPLNWLMQFNEQSCINLHFSITQPHMHKHTNRLINETSPYLLQHAHNPVDWHPWGEEALEKARSGNKVILISIGYSACHWCHVMEHESF